MADRDPRSFFPVEKFGEVVEVVPLTLGLSESGVYAVTTTRGSFVLKIQGAERDGWTDMLRAQRLAAEHGVAPALELVDEAEAVTVSRKVSGVMVAAAVAQPATRAAALASLVEQLAVLHAIPAEGLVSKDPLRVSRSVWDHQVARPGFPPWAIPLGERLAATAKGSRPIGEWSSATAISTPAT